MLYFKYIKLLFKSQMQYKASFIMMAAAQFFTPFSLFAGIYFLFGRFGSIAGWTMYDVFVCFAVIGSGFSVSECFARGFDKFPNMIRAATFDRILVRPRSTVLQVLGYDFDLKRAGLLLSNIVVLAYAISGADIDWNPMRALALINMILSGAVIFSGVFMLQAAAAFWTIETLEVANIFTHGMKEHASYPLDIFPKWITVVFTYIIPFGTVNYLPLQFLVGRTRGGPYDWTYAFIPLAGALFMIPCVFIWRLGVKKYSSAGS